MRLLLLEFFRGALRRNERSMMFPFLQGLAKEKGFRTLWLCYGGGVAHREDAPPGETLFASLPPEDLASLRRHIARFRPTHALSNDELSPRARDLLAAAGVKTLVMPAAGEVPGGSPRWTGEDDFARCGWLLEWLGAGEEGARRFLVERASPDYSATLANRAARAAKPQITLLTGALCAYRRTLAGNPHFAGLEPGAAEHRGCSFCTCATLPPVSSFRDDPLPLIEAQLRAVRATAGKAGRSKGVYELYDIRAFWRFDELFDLVLRLKLPPSVFLFNPRIDDVLRRRARIERVLPRLARAGHEVRMLSMGVENFSPSENERFNKRITLAQFDEFLALARSWSKRFPGVLRPFKDGRAPAELGFILFTPWTTLADLRLNLEAARDRGFPEKGFWLYSILLLEARSPLHRLARAEGGLLAGEFPDAGQYYGLFKNEGELSEVRPWRFKDPKVADVFALLVRYGAAEREGRGCAHFRGDPLFALAERLHREANAPPDGSATPLAVALELLALYEAAAPPASREQALKDAVARAAAAASARKAPPLSPRGLAVARGVEMLRARRPPAFAGMEFGPVEEARDRGASVVRLTVESGGRTLTLDLTDARARRPGFLRSRRFAAAYHEGSAAPTAREDRQLAQFLRLADAAAGGPVTRRAPRPAR